MKKPLIGIVPDYDGGSEKGYSTYPYYVLRSNYIEAVNSAGGTVLVLPYDHESIDQYLSLIDGLVIIGGDFDIDPRKYGAKEIHQTVKLNKKRENFEVELLTKALKTEMPILGICNGMQLMNVLDGGSLIQHIPDEGKFINHEQRKAGAKQGEPYHDVVIDKNSKLFAICTEEKLKTNSSHHQGVKTVGKNLKVSARASDGMIEAIEDVNHPYYVGIQWHPEFETSAADKKIYESFIAAAISRQRTN